MARVAAAGITATCVAFLAAALSGCGQPGMPDVSRMDAAEAAGALRAAEFDARFTWEESTDAAGQVTSQDPAPGQPDPDPRVVRVFVSSGTPFMPDEALGSDWADAFPLGRSDVTDDALGSIASQCSALEGIPSDDITSEGLVVSPYQSPSGVGGGTLLVSVRLLESRDVSAAESLLSEEREAQSACATSAGGADYGALSDAGALSKTLRYSIEAVAGYPALRTDGLFVLASPSLGSGASSMFRLSVTWRQGRYLLEVSRTEVFGQTLPPRVQGVPSDLERAVEAIRSSVDTELARSRDNASAVRAAKQALRDAQSASGSRRGTSSTPVSTTTRPSPRAVNCEPIARTNMSDLTATGLTCEEARRLARVAWFQDEPDGYSCKREMQNESSHTVCTGARGSFGYWNWI